MLALSHQLPKCEMPQIYGVIIAIIIHLSKMQMRNEREEGRKIWKFKSSLQANQVVRPQG